jgi:hypothetical protein
VIDRWPLFRGFLRPTIHRGAGLKALLAHEVGDTSDSVIAQTTGQIDPLLERQNSPKTKLLILTEVVDRKIL